LEQCMIEAENAKVEAGGRTILEIGRLNLGPGLHGIIGPNGSGKTTLLRLLSSIMKGSGRVRVCGLPPAAARRITSYMPSHPQVDLLATALDVILAGLYGSTASRSNALQAARLLGVDDLLDRRFHTLSGGEKRLVCLARALARRPRMLLLDEPLSFLDLANTARVLGLLRGLSRSMPVLITSHELHYVSLMDTVTVLGEGRVLYHGPPSSLRREVLEEVYGLPLLEARVSGLRVFLPADIFSPEHT